METGDCEMGAMHDGYRDDRACAPHPRHGWVSTRRTDTGPYIRPGQDHCLRGHDDVRRAPAPRADAGGGEVVDGKAGRGTSRFSPKNPAPPDTAGEVVRDRCPWKDRG